MPYRVYVTYVHDLNWDKGKTDWQTYRQDCRNNRFKPQKHTKFRDVRNVPRDVRNVPRATRVYATCIPNLNRTEKRTDWLTHRQDCRNCQYKSRLHKTLGTPKTRALREQEHDRRPNGTRPFEKLRVLLYTWTHINWRVYTGLHIYIRGHIYRVSRKLIM